MGRTLGINHKNNCDTGGSAALRRKWDNSKEERHTKNSSDTKDQRLSQKKHGDQINDMRTRIVN